MAEIRLRFARKTGCLARLIRLLGGGPYTHVDAVMPDGMLFGASAHGGVQARAADYAPVTGALVASIAVTPRQERDFWRFLQDHEGDPYDEVAFWGFVTGRAIHEEGRWTCSELPARALEDAKVFPRRLVFPASRISPSALLLAVGVLPHVTFRVEPQVPAAPR